MIHEVDSGFVISARQVWRTGTYDSRKATTWAFRFTDEVLRQLQDAANKRNGGTGGVITADDLK